MTTGIYWVFSLAPKCSKHGTQRCCKESYLKTIHLLGFSVVQKMARVTWAMQTSTCHLLLESLVSCAKSLGPHFGRKKQEIASRGFIFQIRVHLWWYNDITSKCWRILPFLMPSMIQINDNLVTVAAECLSPKQNFHQILGNKPTIFCVGSLWVGEGTSYVDIQGIDMGVSKNSGTPKWMVYTGKPY